MPCAVFYVNNFFSASLARELRGLQRRGRRERPPRRTRRRARPTGREGRRLGNGDSKRHSLQRRGLP
jgi:hypothetical protein